MALTQDPGVRTSLNYNAGCCQNIFGALCFVAKKNAGDLGQSAVLLTALSTNEIEEELNVIREQQRTRERN